MKVVLYSKPGCHLCDDARLIIDDVAARVSFEFDEIDIRTADDLFERYRYRIPVITVDGHELLEGRLEASAVADVLGDIPRG